MIVFEKCHAHITTAAHDRFHVEVGVFDHLETLAEV
jgi:hypothetical protein